MNVSVTEKLFSVSLAGPGALKLKEAGAFHRHCYRWQAPLQLLFLLGRRVLGGSFSKQWQLSDGNACLPEGRQFYPWRAS